MMNTQQKTQQKNKFKFDYFNRIKTNTEFSKLVYGFIDDYSLPLHSYNWSLLDGKDNTKNLHISYNKDKTQLYGYIPRAIGPQDPEGFRQDRRDRTLPVGRSVWTTCGHVVSVWNELALAVRFE